MDPVTTVDRPLHSKDSRGSCFQSFTCHSHPHSVRPFLTVTTVPSWVFLRDRNRAAWLVGDENGCPREPLHSATRLTQQRNKEIMWDAGRFPPLLPRSANRVSREQEEHGRDFITRPTTHYKPMKSLPTSCPSCRFSLRSSLPCGAYEIIMWVKWL